MKKSLFVVSLLLMTSMSCLARQLSPDEALQRSVVTNVAKKQALKTEGLRLLHTQTTKHGDAALYIFGAQNRGGLILSADDEIVPVLGYLDNPVDGAEMPVAMRDWLETMAEEINLVTTQGVRSELPPSVGKAIDPLLPCTWGQTDYYDKYTPVVNGNQSPSGCVATALAQIMYYYRWPQSPTGTASCTDSNDKKYSMDMNGITFNWDAMTDEYDDNSSSTSIDAVSTLMKCVGYSVNMSYGPYSSGATTANAMSGMVKNMKYSKDMSYVRRESFLREEWERMLYSMLEAGMPIYHTGRDAVWLLSGGHAFVCDGYNGEGYFHFNWGWDGSYNGYFLTSCLTPAGAGTGGFINGYNYSQEVIVNLYPDDSKQRDSFVYVGGSDFSYSKYTSQISATFRSYPSLDATYQIGVTMTPYGGGETKIVPGAVLKGESKHSLTIDNSMTAELDPAQAYELRIVWRPDASSSWQRVLPPTEGFVLYYAGDFGGILSFDGSEWTFNQQVIDCDKFDITVNSILFNDADFILYNQKNVLTIDVTNNQDDYFYHAARLCFQNPETDNRDGFINFSLEVSPDYRSVDKYSISSFSTVKPGKYYLKLIEANTDKEIWSDYNNLITVYSESQIHTFTYGRMKYSLLPNEQLLFLGTETGSRVGGDVIIPKEVEVNGKTYQVPSIHQSLSDLIDRSTVKSLTITYPFEEISSSQFYNCPMLEYVELPEGLLSIGSEGFASCASLKTIKLPSTLTNIGRYAFSNCVSLSNIQFPESLQTIDARAFSGCKSLESVIIPKNVDTIGNYTFYECENLKEVTLPETLEEFGVYVFYKCESLESINLPKNITSIKENTFRNCINLKEVNFPESLQTIDKFAFYGCSSLKAIIIPDNVTSIEEYAFYNCSNAKEIYTGKKVTVINDKTFYGCANVEILNFPSIENIPSNFLGYSNNTLKTLTLGDGVKTLGPEAFSNCSSLEEINFGKNISVIGKYAFNSCNLKEVNLPESLEVIGEGVFANCSSLELIIIPQNIKFIPDYTFSNCESLKEVNLSESLEEIGKSAFYNCISLESIIIPDNVTTIGENAFSNCSGVKEINTGKQITEINPNTFSGCTTVEKLTIPSIENIPSYFLGYSNNSLKSLTLGDGVKTLEPYSFYKCTSLEEINFGGNLSSIGKWAFYDCQSLESIFISDNVTFIGEYAFSNCSSVKEINTGKKLTEINPNTFSGCTNVEKLTIPSIENIPSRFLGYSNNSLKSLNLGDGVKTFMNNSFNSCTNLEEINFGNNLSSIGDYAFSGCSNLKELNLPESLEEIGKNTFYNCTSLEAIIIPDNVTSVGERAFYNCSGVKEINTGKKVTVINGHPFYGCTNVEILTIPSIENIPSYFLGASNNSLMSLTLGDGVKTLESYAFYNCTGLEEIDFNESLISIEKYAFYNCSNLQILKFPESLQEIKNDAFYNCSSLREIYFPASLQTIGSFAFNHSSDEYKQFIVCGSEVPPMVESTTGFTFSDYDNTTLYVPEGSGDAYASHPVWGLFKNINRGMPSDANNIFVDRIVDDETDGSTISDAENETIWFTLSGMRLFGKPSVAGVYIRVKGSERSVVRL